MPLDAILSTYQSGTALLPFSGGWEVLHGLVADAALVARRSLT